MTRTFRKPAPCLPTRGPGVVPWLCVLLTGALADPADAVTIRVHPDSAAVPVPGYVATLFEANAIAANGDSVEVSDAGSPYIHTTFFPLLDGVVYRGGFGPAFEGPNASVYETTIELQLPPDSTDSVIDARDAGPTSLFAGFTVTGGDSPFSAGGLLCFGASSSLAVRNCRFVGNVTVTVGGGIAISSGATPTIFNCDFEQNSAGWRGGGISISAGCEGTVIEFCRIVACSANAGGAALGGGGGIFSASGILFKRNEIRDCYTDMRGGAILTRNTLQPFRLHVGKIENCEADLGGAVYQDGGQGAYGKLEITGCSAVQDGGAFYFENGTSDVYESFIRDCTAGRAGGGFHYFETSGSQLRTCEIVNNQAQRGGGVSIRGRPFARSYSVEILSNTFFGNGATEFQAGGGIHIEAGDFLDPVVNNIIAFQTDGSGISCFGAKNQPNLRFNCLYNVAAENADPVYDGDCDDRTGINGNVRVDPLFCDTTLMPPQLGLKSFSPCFETGEGGVNMGAHQGSDCSTPNHVEPATWSRIKSFYR